MAPKTKTAQKAHGKKAASISHAQAEIFDSDSDGEKQLAHSKTQFDEENGSGSDSDDDESMDFIMDREEEEPKKDEEEEELERLIFGDSQGFREAVGQFSLDERGGYGGESGSEAEEGADLNEIPDQDLFFFDSGPGPAPAGALVAQGEESEEEGDKPAWEDSDDERLAVSLAAVPRLRKLRETEEDDVVSGKEYVRRLRKQYQRLYPTPEWALLATGAKRKRTRTVEDGESGDESVSEMDEDEDDLSTQPLARLLKDADILSRNSRGPVKRRRLQAGTVDIQGLRGFAKKGPSAVTSLSFHPTYPLLLSSGPSSTLNLYHVAPNAQPPNPLLTSLHMKRTPLTTTAFHPLSTDSRIFLSARRRYFHVWNLATGSIEKVSRVYGHQHEQRTMEHFSLSPNGKYMALRGSSKKGGGVVNILDAYTLQWITQARIESHGGIADFVWWGDGNGMSIAGKNGEVTEYSMKDGVVARWTDEGAVVTTAIAVGGKSGRDNWLGGDRWVALGSSSGMVNIYDRRAWMDPTASDNQDANMGIPKNPKPMKTLGHLTVPTSHLAFSPDGQVLCMASQWKSGALKLVHLPSGTVFKNWPTVKSNLGRITAVAWGRPSEEDEKEGSLALLAIGSETGRIKMWEVKAPA